MSKPVKDLRTAQNEMNIEIKAAISKFVDKVGPCGVVLTGGIRKPEIIDKSLGDDVQQFFNLTSTILL